MMPWLEYTRCPWHNKASPELSWVVPGHPPFDQILGLVSTSEVPTDVSKDGGIQAFINAFIVLNLQPLQGIWLLDAH